MAERLKRLDRLFIRSPIYFVTACTHTRRPLLASSDIHEAFKSFAARGEDFGAWVGAYILMPDHLHLFVALDDERIRLAQWMKALKGQVSATLRGSGHEAPFWQKGFFDYVLRSSDSYSAKWEYVRQNSVRAGLTSAWETWPYLGEILPLEYRHHGERL